MYIIPSKLLLGLGACQSTDFDAKIASATFCMTHYIALAHQKRISSYQAIGGLFRECGRQATEALQRERILAIIRHLVEEVRQVFDKDIDQSM